MSMTTEEFLEHHGIKGQKWGVLRYQNKDGSLTPLGRIRYGVGQSKTGGKKSSSASNTSKKSSSSSSSKETKEAKPKKKSVSEMTDDELRKTTDRMRLEQTYTQLLSQTTPKPQTSKGKKFASTLFNEVIKPAAISSGKSVLNDLLTKYMKEIAGLNTKDANAAQKKYLNDLKDEVQRLTLESQKRKLKGES